MNKIVLSKDLTVIAYMAGGRIHLVDTVNNKRCTRKIIEGGYKNQGLIRYQGCYHSIAHIHEDLPTRWERRA